MAGYILTLPGNGEKLAMDQYTLSAQLANQSRVGLYNADGSLLLPLAAALADDVAMPTTTLIGAVLEAVKATDTTKLGRLLESAGALYVLAQASEAHAGEVGGHMALAPATELTRPANATAYAAGDAVSNSTSAPVVLTFANAARVAAGSGFVVGCRLITSQKANTARFRLHLFHTAPTAINDNDVQTLLYANKAKRIGSITLPAMTTEDTTSTAAEAFDFTIRIPFVCDNGSRDITGLLETLDAFTPDSAQTFYAELIVADN